MVPGLPPPTYPDELGGGCVGEISTTLFRLCLGGWQGCALSINGRGMHVSVLNSSFEDCKGGAAHTRDGKGGAIAIGGGIQKKDPPTNEVVVRDSSITRCQASGNRGGVYVTIRGRLKVESTSVHKCAALNSATSLPTLDWRKVEGMGGAIHCSAGGYVNVHNGVVLSANNAAVNGGGLSVKTGDAHIYGSILVDYNTASGSAIDGFGNGGGVFITTSRWDDTGFIGPDWGGAYVYGADGYFQTHAGVVTINVNAANRWGGGVYGGISPVWGHEANAVIVLVSADVFDNTAGRRGSITALFPAQLAGEHLKYPVGGSLSTQAQLKFDDTMISGNAASDIGIYTIDSVVPSTVGTTFGTLASPVVAE